MSLQSSGGSRGNELVASCKYHEVAGSVQALHIEELKDSLTAEWNTETVTRVIALHSQNIKPDFIISFDNIGVSQHPNHIAVHNGVMFEKITHTITLTQFLIPY